MTADEQRARWRVYGAVRYALKVGRLARPTACDMCGKVPPPSRDGRCSLQAHHADYAKPLDVQWRCLGCHDEVTPHPKGEMNGAYTKPHRVGRGESHGMAILSESEVLEIRRRHAAGGISFYQLGKEFGIDRKAVGDLVKGKTWRHVA